MIRAMSCFCFSNKKEEEETQSAISISVNSIITPSMDCDTSKSTAESISQIVTDMTTDTSKSTAESISQIVTDMTTDSLGSSEVSSMSQRPSNLQVFTFSELKSVTRNFSRQAMIGEGGFGRVYRGTIKSSEDQTRLEIAVKQLNRKGLQGHKEWLNELNVLGVVEHPNLVKLVGYCAEDAERGMQRLLVYEYMSNGSVEDHLSTRMTTTLSWPIRLRIALDAARGLAYLHEGMDFQIIFRDFKTSNILLDENWNAKLSDFGLARQGPTEGLSHVSTAVVGTMGYAAPEYMQTGHLTAKNDIWSYGVVLYELITGRRPLDRNRPKGEQKLLEWVKPYIADVKKFHMILDPRLEGHYSLRSAAKLASVANRCLLRHAKARPNMSAVLEMVQRIVENTETGAPQPPLKSPILEKETSDEGKKKGPDLKRRTGDLKLEGRRLVWRGWIPRLVRAH